MMLTPLGILLSQDLGDRGCYILATLQGLPLEHQLDLACRTILAILLTFQPDRSSPKAKRDAFKTICDGVQVGLKGEIAEMRRSQPLSKKDDIESEDPAASGPCVSRDASSRSVPTTNPRTRGGRDDGCAADGRP